MAWSRRGSAHHNARLTDDQVRQIRDEIQEGARTADVAAKFGVSVSTISGIRSGCGWRHVKSSPALSEVGTASTASVFAPGTKD